MIGTDQYLTSRKVNAMLATTMTLKENTRGNNQEPRWTTYLPSTLILCLALENGWKIAEVVLTVSENQSGLIYLVTLKSNSRQPDQHLVLPKNTLVEKMLDEHAQTSVAAQAGSLN